MITVVGWDVGGANVKAAWLAYEQGRALQTNTVSHPYEIWLDKARLPHVLQDVLQQATAASPLAMALTMTAELADIFTTRREGVQFVLDHFLHAFPGCPAYALSLRGQFVPLPAARERPLDFAAANWLATARFVARQHPNCLLVDTGSTTTDIIPIIDGQPAARGRTDLQRLIAGELVYTGVLRTHLAAIVREVPVDGHFCPVSSEYFAISGDVHLILGHLTPTAYTCPTPDGRPPTLASARRRLARLVCADTEMLDNAIIDEMARFIYRQQLQQIGRALRQVRARFQNRRTLPVVPLGSGAFLATAAARHVGMEIAAPAEPWDPGASAVAPSLAVAHLLAEQLETEWKVDPTPFSK